MTRLVPVWLVRLASLCPRMAWLQAYQGTPRLESIRRGLEAHRRLNHAAIAKAIGAEDYRVEVELESEKLGVRGRADMIALIQGTWIPVEYKHTTLITRQHLIQATIYALILEEKQGKPVTTIYIATPTTIKKHHTTGKLRKQAIQAINQTKTIIQTPTPPPPKPKPLCKTCPHKKYCTL